MVAANNLAWIYADRREHLELALQLAQRSAAERPGDADVQDTLGWVYYQKQAPKLAIGPFQQSVAGAPLNPTYRYHLALAYARSGDVENARRAVEVALKLNPDFSEAQRLYASLQ